MFITKTRATAPSRIACRTLALCLALLFLLPLAVEAAGPTVTAQGMILINADTGEVYCEKNADLARPSASMTKLMSLYLVFEEIAAGRLSLSTPVFISDKAAAMSSDRNYSGYEQLPRGGSFDVDTLIRLVMTVSANGSMLALAEQVAGTEAAFVERMNAKAVAWGIPAHFTDCTGYVDEGNAITPRAMAELARRILKDYPEIVQYSSLKSTKFQEKTFKTTNTLLRDDLYLGIDGLKTGTTKGAGYCFAATALRDGRRVISVVMASANAKTRMSDTTLLLDYGFSLQRPHTFEGELGIASLKLRAGYAVTVPLSVRCVQGTSCVVPVGWYLNGEPIPGYANPAFRMQPKASSAYTFRTSKNTPKGTYSLSFRCNPNENSSAEFFATIEVI